MNRMKPAMPLAALACLNPTALSRRRFLGVAMLVAGITAWPAAGRVAHAADAATATAATSAASSRPKIGIIGSGRIGSTLGTAWLRSGHEVMFSSLDLEQDKALAAKLGKGAHAGTPREAAAFGEVLLVSVPYSALPQLGKDLAGEIRGKVIIDTSNPIPGRDGEVATQALARGAGLASADMFPGARIVRAFNAIGFGRLQAITQGQSSTVGMPIAGDDAHAIAVASALVREARLEPVLVGPLTMGRHLRPGTPLAGELTPDQIRKLIPTLN